MSLADVGFKVLTLVAMKILCEHDNERFGSIKGDAFLE